MNGCVVCDVCKRQTTSAQLFIVRAMSVAMRFLNIQSICRLTQPQKKPHETHRKESSQQTRSNEMLRQKPTVRGGEHAVRRVRSGATPAEEPRALSDMRGDET